MKRGLPSNRKHPPRAVPGRKRMPIMTKMKRWPPKRRTPTMSYDMHLTPLFVSCARSLNLKTKTPSPLGPAGRNIIASRPTEVDQPADFLVDEFMPEGLKSVKTSWERDGSILEVAHRISNLFPLFRAYDNAGKKPNPNITEPHLATLVTRRTQTQGWAHHQTPSRW